jgi:hypothetical protein
MNSYLKRRLPKWLTNSNLFEEMTASEEKTKASAKEARGFY